MANAPTNEITRANNTGTVMQPASAEIISLDTTAISRYQTPDERTFATMCKLAEGFARSGMFAAKSTETALAILMTGGELGLMPAQSMRSIHIIQNRPVLSAELMVAVVRKRTDVCRFFQLVKTDHEVAIYRTHRVGDPEPTEFKFSIQDAQRAKLTSKDIWTQYPAAMLRSRCASALVKAVYSDIVLGLYTPEEAESIPVYSAAVVASTITPITASDEDYAVRRSTLIELLKSSSCREKWLDKIVSMGGTRKVAGLSLDQMIALCDQIIEQEADPFSAANQEKLALPEPAKQVQSVGGGSDDLEGEPY